MRSVSSARRRAASSAAATESNIHDAVRPAPRTPRRSTSGVAGSFAGVLCRVGDIGQRRERPDDPAHVLVRRYRDHQVEPVPDERTRGARRPAPPRRPGCARRRAASWDGARRSPSGPASGRRRAPRASSPRSSALVDQRLERPRSPRPRSAPRARRTSAGTGRRRSRATPRIRSACPPIACSRSSTSKSRYSSFSVAPTSAHRCSITRSASSSCSRLDRDGALLDDARLLPRHLGDRRTRAPGGRARSA